MKDREEVHERIASGDFSASLYSQVQKRVLTLLRQSILPLWKGTSSFKEALKTLGMKDLNELRVARQQMSTRPGSKTIEEMTMSVEDV